MPKVRGVTRDDRYEDPDRRQAARMAASACEFLSHGSSGWAAKEDQIHPVLSPNDLLGEKLVEIRVHELSS